MKKSLIVFIAGILGLNPSVFADEAQAKKLTLLQRQQIARAIKVLVQTKTLTSSENQCVSFDQDILDLLEAEGQIQSGDAQPNTICIGPATNTK